MSEQQHPLSGEWRVNRRRFVHAVGAGAAVGGMGYVAQTDENESDDGNATDDGAGNETGGEAGETTAGDDGIHPVFGFAGESESVEPPVEPDHEVTLEMTIEAGNPQPEFYFEPTGLYVEPGETVQFTLVSPEHTVTAYHPNFGRTRRVPEAVGSISSPFLWEGSYFLYTFEEPGVYDLYCAPHEFLGMAIRVVAGEATGPGAEPVPEPMPGEGMPPGGVGPDENATGAAGGLGADDETNVTDDANLTDGENETNATADANETNVTDDAGDGEDGGPFGGELQPPLGLSALVLADPNLDPDEIVDRGSVSWDDLEDESKTFPGAPGPEAGGNDTAAGEGDDVGDENVSDVDNASDDDSVADNASDDD